MLAPANLFNAHTTIFVINKNTPIINRLSKNTFHFGYANCLLSSITFCVNSSSLLLKI
jgi:hypothetical protein